MRRLPFFLGLALALSCSESRLRVSAGEVSLDPDRLAFGDTYVGFATQRSLTLRNDARGARTVVLSTAAPFTLHEGAVTLQAGAAVEVQVRFEPTAVGPSRGVLRVDVDAASVEIALEGDGVAPEVCTALPCREAHFDPAAGRCVDAPAADGTSCEGANACLLNAHCAAGSCVGEARRCDDGNACTLDACDPGAGCVNVDRSSSCAQPADSCKAAVCDPQKGCGVVDVADGTPCGATDCTRANICLAGACKTVTPPDGFTCAAATPCQAKGVCQNQVCVRPPAQVLAPVWTRAAPTGGFLHFSGTTDAAGNLYWIECTVSSCALISATSDGLPRFSHALAGGFWSAPDRSHRPLLVAGSSVIVQTECGALEALKTTDGTFMWQSRLPPDIANNAPSGDGLAKIVVGSVRIRSVAYDGQGALRLAVQTGLTGACDASFGEEDAPPQQGSLLVTLSLATGAVVSKLKYGATLAGPFADEDGNLVLSGTPPLSSRRLFSLDAKTTLRWSLAASERLGSAALADARLLTPHGQLHDLATGAPLQGGVALEPLPSHPLLETPSPLLFQGGALAFGTDDGATPGAVLARRDALTGASTWQRPISAVRAPAMTQPLGLADGSALFAVSDVSTPLLLTSPDPWRGDSVLVAIAPSGEERFRCALPKDELYMSGATLVNGRWYALTRASATASRLSAFDVPGLSLAPAGWVAEGGSPLRQGRPR